MPSDCDHTITFYLRNPQKYNLTVTEGPDPVISLGDPDLFTFTDSTYSVLRLNLPQFFLKNNDEGKNVAHFSPTIILTEQNFGREFDPYHLELHINTPPPAPHGAVVMLDKTDEDNPKYVLCFNLPAAGAFWDVHQDLKTLSINGRIFEISVNDGNVSITNAGNLTTSKPANLAPNEAGGKFEFADDGGQAFYYLTGEAAAPETIKGKSYTITLTDNAGLSTSVLANADTAQIKAPLLKKLDQTDITAEIEAQMEVLTQQSDGTCKVQIQIPSECVDADGKSKGTVTGNTVEYKIYYHNGTEYSEAKSGSVSAATTNVIAVDPGKKCKIELVSKKPGYIESETKTYFVSGKPETLWVSEYAAPNGNGTKAAPFALLNDACNLVTSFQAEKGTENAAYTVNVTGTIRGGNAAVPFSDGFEGSAFVANIRYQTTYSKPYFSLTIQGADGKRAVLDANRGDSAHEKGSVLYISVGKKDNKITLKNLDITGSNTDVAGENGKKGAVQIGYGTVTIENCNIYGNKGQSGGGITVTSSDNNVTIKGGSIHDNTAKAGGAVLAAGKDELKIEKCSIFKNTSTDSTSGGGAVCVSYADEKATFTNVNFYQNEAKNGGALYVSNASSVILNGCHIYSNTAKSGGGIYTKKMVTLEDTVIEGNTATTSGSGIYVVYSTSVDLRGGTEIKTGNSIYLENNFSDSDTNGNSYARIVAQDGKFNFSALTKDHVADIELGLKSGQTTDKWLGKQIINGQNSADPHEGYNKKFSLVDKSGNELSDCAINEKGIIDLPLVTTKEQFEKLMNDVGPCEGLTIKLGCDVVVPSDREGCAFAGDFKGTIDGGNDHSITINNNKPLVEVLSGGTIKNLTLRGTVDGMSGAFAESTGGSGSQIENCVNFCTVTNNASDCYAGGFIGHAQGSVTINNCDNKAAITGKAGAGGFIGICYSATNSSFTVNLTNCKNSGTIAADSNNGAIIGDCKDNKVTVTLTGCSDESGQSDFVGADAGNVTITP